MTTAANWIILSPFFGLFPVVSKSITTYLLLTLYTSNSQSIKRYHKNRKRKRSKTIF